MTVAALRYQRQIIRTYAAFVTPSGRVYHWVDEAQRGRAICGTPNRGWRRVLDLRGDALNATERARECERCDEAWTADRKAATETTHRSGRPLRESIPGAAT